MLICLFAERYKNPPYPEFGLTAHSCRFFVFDHPSPTLPCTGVGVVAAAGRYGTGAELGISGTYPVLRLCIV